MRWHLNCGRMPLTAPRVLSDNGPTVAFTCTRSEAERVRCNAVLAPQLLVATTLAIDHCSKGSDSLLGKDHI
jgi:hypothetical protein